MTLTQLLERRNVPVAGPGQKNYRAGWVHVRCPHCDDTGFHLGFPDGGYGGRCFKCGQNERREDSGGRNEDGGIIR